MNRIVPVVLLLVFLADVAAQETPLIAPGTWVRVEVLAGSETRNLSPIYQQSRWLRGSLVSLDADTLVIKSVGRGVPVAIPRSRVVEFAVSQSRNMSSRGVSALGGAGFGFLANFFLSQGLEDEALSLAEVLSIAGPGALFGATSSAVVSSLDTLGIVTRVGTGAAAGLFTGALFAGLLELVYNKDVETFVVVVLDGGLIGALAGAVVRPSERWKSVRLPLHVGLSPHGGGYIALCFELGKW